MTMKCSMPQFQTYLKERDWKIITEGQVYRWTSGDGHTLLILDADHNIEFFQYSEFGRVTGTGSVRVKYMNSSYKIDQLVFEYEIF